ncbi:MAG: hypothetical protein P8Y47_04850 [Alphaproteobacteria bacterium]
MAKNIMTEEDEKWRAEEDLRTLINAEKIKKDKTSYDAAMKARKEQIAALENIED